MTNIGDTFCGQCRTVIPDETPGSDRLPCPECGSSARIFDCSVSESVCAHDHFGFIQKRESLEIAFGESERRNGAAAHASLENGHVHTGASGPGSQNEDDSLATCFLLVAFLNARGDSWSPLMVGSGDVDGYSSNPNGEKLCIQVVRAQTDNTFWLSLSKQQSASVTSDVFSAATALWKAICLKSKIPPGQRLEITLALDANRTPGLAFGAVIEVFASHFGAMAQDLGFAAIYVVGPEIDLVRRLA